MNMSAVLGNGDRVTWLGHATTLIECSSGARILIDPWVQTNPSCPSEHHILAPVDIILITHGHGDHLGDVLDIVRDTPPTSVIAIHEIASWLSHHGVGMAQGMNRGGTIRLGEVSITMVAAVHSSSIHGVDGAEYPGGEACGFVITLANGYRIYHAGDTDVFGDMALIGAMHHPDLALLPIGDHYTMGPAGGAHAAHLLGVSHVIPIHWGTFPALTGTPEALREAIGGRAITVHALRPGESIL